jgi:hypothetical protein
MAHIDSGRARRNMAWIFKRGSTMKLSKTILAAAAMGLGVMVSAPAHAGPASEALSKCLVEKTDAADRAALARWIFTVISYHHSVRDMVNMSDAQRTELNKEGAAVFTRLMAYDCGTQSRAALFEDGEEGFSDAFGVVGELAIEELLGAPEVDAGMDDMLDYVDSDAIGAALFPSSQK